MTAGGREAGYWQMTRVNQMVFDSLDGPLTRGGVNWKCT